MKASILDLHDAPPYFLEDLVEQAGGIKFPLGSYMDIFLSDQLKSKQVIFVAETLGNLPELITIKMNSLGIKKHNVPCVLLKKRDDWTRDSILSAKYHLNGKGWKIGLTDITSKDDIEYFYRFAGFYPNFAEFTVSLTEFDKSLVDYCKERKIRILGVPTYDRPLGFRVQTEFACAHSDIVVLPGSDPRIAMEGLWATRDWIDLRAEDYEMNSSIRRNSEPKDQGDYKYSTYLRIGGYNVKCDDTNGYQIDSIETLNLDPTFSLPPIIEEDYTDFDRELASAMLDLKPRDLSGDELREYYRHSFDAILDKTHNSWLYKKDRQIVKGVYSMIIRSRIKDLFGKFFNKPTEEIIYLMGLDWDRNIFWRKHVWKSRRIKRAGSKSKWEKFKGWIKSFTTKSKL